MATWLAPFSFLARSRRLLIERVFFFSFFSTPCLYHHMFRHLLTFHCMFFQVWGGLKRQSDTCFGCNWLPKPEKKYDCDVEINCLYVCIRMFVTDTEIIVNVRARGAASSPWKSHTASANSMDFWARHHGVRSQARNNSHLIENFSKIKFGSCLRSWSWQNEVSDIPRHMQRGNLN